MPYNRDEVITSVTDYYNFLTTHLHFRPSHLKTAPDGPDGWPQINPSRFAFLRKSARVIDLLQHLPYLECYPTDVVIRKEIWPHTVCADYSDEKKIESAVKYDDRDVFEPLEDIMEVPWEKWADRRQDVVVIGMPECGDKGNFIFVDTIDGEVAVWDVMSTNYDYFESAAECFADMRRKFEKLEMFAVPDVVVPLINEGDEGFKEIVRSLGWPPSQDGSKWNREEGMKEVERRWPEFD